MRKISLALLVLITAGCFTACGQIFNKSRLDSLLNALEQNNKGMGTLVLSKDGKVIYQKSTGYESVVQGVKASAVTRYRIGSITKMFTAVIVFQLIEEGKLSLDTRLSEYYPQVPNADKITIRLMLNHRSGLHNFTDSAYTTYYTQPKTHEQLVQIFATQTPDFEPDAKASYSNTNFVLLGYIAEKITGKKYSWLLKSRITDKIGLKDTYYGGKVDLKVHEAASYRYAGGWQEEAQTDMSIPGGAGAIVSTPVALTKFIEALFAGKLVSLKSLEVMKTLKDNYGSAMFRYNFDNKLGYGHNGGIDEFKSTLSYFPEEKLTIAYCSNGMNYNMNNIVLGALSIYFGKPFQIPSFKIIEVSAEELSKYVGNYVSDQLPLKISITQKEGVLTAQATGQSAFPLDAADKDKFTFEPAGIVMEFAPEKGEMTLKQNGRSFLYIKEK
ncbi:class A beta-lactamase-related serine hydrolase [Mucilaginibacter limnophilus]|uniref:Class A beta-lactamase-related serine hydrolase n=1 Tax=Mucilaginibacter limnophilus TaxID=1932778 RepID=A0A437MG02_9SPHI|nr:serine hydrolase domain-containing protein [Mucilaginibacter limnophilus]RVT96574.1 class A beta-lactamase-related serine hydrolase [Mucilaginibacter limnophilus]